MITITLLELVIPVLITVGFLIGIRLMQSPRTALWGNRLGAFCMVLAIGYVFLVLGVVDSLVWLYIFLGGIVGIFLARQVKMIQMPQTVALFNGLGGGASALVAGTAMIMETNAGLWLFWLTAALALGIGTLTFTGSVVAALKLQGLISQKPVFLKGHGLLLRLLLLAGAAFIIVILFQQAPTYQLFVLVLFALYGFLMALRVGGADMPVIISFLNSLSGVAASVSGLAVGNFLLAGVGALVGVAGMILTQLMCKAMNRNLPAVLGGFKTEAKKEKDKETVDKASDAAEAGQFVNGGQTVEKEIGDAPEGKAAGETPGKEASPAGEEAAVPAGDAPSLLREAGRVIIVPGYGMALAQAQQSVKSLIDALEQDGKEVKVAIHPVAGRMPGHMNVLLAEVGVDYEKLYEMDAINPEFAETDVVVVVGASDVINPAAATAEGTPIYGMPVLHVSEAKSIIICNRGWRSAYSGVDNPLYEQENTVTLFGDAAETVPKLLEDYKTSPGDKSPDAAAKEETPSAGEEPAVPAVDAPSLLREAGRVIIVPGYGMALAQAQQSVKSLIDALEQDGKEVKVAIHPVAGRMPGHMNVLLAEVGVDYEKLYEMDAINPEFAETDVVVVVGASDVINPAAATAEGTPIYGMPVLHVSEAKSIIICNRGWRSAYSGVDNPLYEQENTAALLGDAAETVPKLLEDYRKAK